MSSSKRIAEFPDVEAKLQKPTKQSAFERQKAEAEAKRQREAAETAAVYEDFVKSFDAGAGDGDHGRSQRGGGGGGGGGPALDGRGGTAGFAGRGGGRRHFGGAAGGLGGGIGGSSGGGMKSSGPGTLGPAPPSFGKKRTHDGFAAGAGSAGRLGFDDEYYDDGNRGSKPLARAFVASDDDDDGDGDDGEHRAGLRSEDKAVAKPTLRLANLPPATSPAVIKALVPSSLAVEGVKILPTPAQGTDRKSIAAIVTLSPETAASDIDAAVSALQNRYLGFGHYLSLHRHLSSAAMATASEASVAGLTTGSHPFGAKPVAAPGPGGGGPGGHHHHHHHHRGGPGRFAPPSSYGPAAGAPLNRNLLHVPIQPPTDIKQLRMIHKVIESVLAHGPELEALLMTRPDVQREERWAWIWDARSQGGIWYRWRLWEILTGGGGQPRRGKRRYLPLFEGSHAWKVPEKELAYEYTTAVDGFVSEPEYDSEFDDEDEDEPKITTDGSSKAEEEVFLNPIEKAKLVHLLARLPTTLSKIRKGDIARITSFAITHANRGADEIVDLIVSNIEKPLSFSSANPDYQRDVPDPSDGSRDASPAPGEKKREQQQQQQPGDPAAAQDTSGAKLVGLYVISDILSSSSTSGVRHAWRYRQLLEAALKARHVFEGLGLLPERTGWGRLRAEKWKRSIGLVLSLWDGWCVFPNDSQELFARSFESPPGARKDEKAAAGEEAERARGRWKTVEAASAAAAAAAAAASAAAAAATSAAAAATPEGTTPDAGDDDGAGWSDDGSYDEYTDDEDADNELLAHYHIDGESLLDIDIVGLVIEGEGGAAPGEPEEQGAGPEPAPKSTGADGFKAGGARPPAVSKRKRMTAADMFADSDSGEDR